jgi:FAD/FMN-containing dehydrogenase
MLELLRAAIDPAHVLGEVEAEAYRHGNVKPIVVAPGSTDEASALMQLAVREGWSVVCAGAGTRLENMHQATAPDIVISTRRLNRISEYEPADLVMTAQAGVPLVAIERATQQHKQFLALDPPVHAQSTVGSVIATASAGPLRFTYGTPRDHVLGMQLVAGDGRMLHFGGKVVKNVAGYDVVRPLVGSHGTLGLIAEVSVRLRPLPEVDQTLLLSAPTFVAAAELSTQIIAARLDIVALEIVSPAFVDGSSAAEWTVLARLHGNAEAVSDSIARIGAIAAARMAESSLWRNLGAREFRAPWLIRFANLPARLQETAAQAASFAREALSGDVSVAAHAGDGIVRLLADDVNDAFEQLVSNEREVIRDHGGTLLVERAARPLVRRPAVTSEAAPLMAGVKRVFDPAGIFAESLAV